MKCPACGHKLGSCHTYGSKSKEEYQQFFCSNPNCEMFEEGDFKFSDGKPIIKVDYQAYRKQKMEMMLDWFDRMKRGTEIRREWIDTRLGQASAKSPKTGVWKTGRDVIMFSFGVVRVNAYKGPLRFGRKYESPKDGVVETKNLKIKGAK